MSFEKLWEDIVGGNIAGVNIVRESLQLSISEGEDVGQLLEEKKGHFSKELKGWLLDFRRVKVSPSDSSGRGLNVKAVGHFAVFKPSPGLKISTNFRRCEDGQALCGAKVRVFLMPLYCNIGCPGQLHTYPCYSFRPLTRHEM